MLECFGNKLIVSKQTRVYIYTSESDKVLVCACVSTLDLTLSKLADVKIPSPTCHFARCSLLAEIGDRSRKGVEGGRGRGAVPSDQCEFSADESGMTNHAVRVGCRD